MSGPRGSGSSIRVRRRAALALALAAGPVAQGCVWYPRPNTTPSTDPAVYVVGWTQTGVASWYGEPFHGRRAAAGGVYDMDAMTAAHQTIPFGTRIRVDNRDNGRSVELVVNDRGPFVRGRILDVSRAGAQELGMIGPGTARVRITIVESANAVSARGGCVLIQVASYGERASAEAKRREVEQAGFEAAIEPFEEVYRVVAGPFADEAAARRAAEGLGGFLRRC
ncbi:septal ring lytic transglycosylase RlpA family protein [Candidatus Palauibacter sp.]|uniref:septal ring lytic transglycosylase RlpA family protein n=1 Tax=Candidatus Palauibacter sp. TaxID=3101350 RepID=UPI003B5C0D02